MEPWPRAAVHMTAYQAELALIRACPELSPPEIVEQVARVVWPRVAATFSQDVVRAIAQDALDVILTERCLGYRR